MRDSPLLFPLALASALLLASCDMDIPVGSNYLCDDRDQCPEGYRCTAGSRQDGNEGIKACVPLEAGDEKALSPLEPPLDGQGQNEPPWDGSHDP